MSTYHYCCGDCEVVENVPADVDAVLTAALKSNPQARMVFLDKSGKVYTAKPEGWSWGWGRRITARERKQLV
jgi:hypothetical protein